MPNLADTYLYQARGFLLRNDARKAIELLERAKALSINDPQRTAAALRELVTACRQAGRLREANEYFILLQTYNTPPVGKQPANRSFEAWVSHLLGKRKILLSGGLGLVILFVILLTLWRLYAGSPISKSIQPRETDDSLGAPAKHGESAQATGPNDNDPLAAGEILRKENIGIVFLVSNYRRLTDNKKLTINYPLFSGAAFAVAGYGVGTMVTSSRVVTVPLANPFPEELSFFDQPYSREDDPYFVVSFGPDRQYDVHGIQQNDPLDLAVMYIDRKFAQPLKLAEGIAHQSSLIAACGYDAQALDKAKDGSYLSDEKRKPMQTELDNSGRLQWLESFDKSCFSNVTFKGSITQSAEANARGDIQFDANTDRGYGGGPLLNRENEVVGVVRLNPEMGAGDTYNLAVPAAQIISELEKFATRFENTLTVGIVTSEPGSGE